MNFFHWHLESRGNEDMHPAFVWGDFLYVHLGSLVCQLRQNNKIYVHFHMLNTLQNILH